MSTEFYFRSRIRHDTPDSLVTWLHDIANRPNHQPEPFDGHEFFTRRGWPMLFYGCGCTHHACRPIVFEKPDREGFLSGQIIIQSSFKNTDFLVEAFVDWIEPNLEAYGGDFLGYSLYEDSRPTAEESEFLPDRERPTLYFMSDEHEVPW